MLVDTLCSVAFYCQRCGQIEITDVPVFTGHGQQVLRCSHCGAEKAKLRFEPHSGLVIETACSVCGSKNRLVYPLRQLRGLRFEKVYCGTDHFELGYIGRRRRIEELMRFNQEEFEALHPHDGKNFIEKQRILLEALNRVHDMARVGDIVCPCGSEELTADIRGSYIVLECEHCGSSCVLRAENAGDLKKLRFGVGLRAPSRA